MVIGYAFVYFLDAYAALRCVHAMRDIDLDGIRFECCLSYKTQSTLKAKSQTQQKTDQPQLLSPPTGNEGISPTSSAYTSSDSNLVSPRNQYSVPMQQAFSLPPARQQQGRGGMMMAEQPELSYEGRYRAYPPHEQQQYHQQGRHQQYYQQQQQQYQPRDYGAAHQGRSSSFMAQQQQFTRYGNGTNAPASMARKPKFISEVSYQAHEPMYQPASYDMSPRHFESAAASGMPHMSLRGTTPSYVSTRGNQQQQPEHLFRNQFAYEEAHFGQGDRYPPREVGHLLRQEHSKDYHHDAGMHAKSYLFEGPQLSPVLDGVYGLHDRQGSSHSAAVVTPPESFRFPCTSVSKESLSRFTSDIWSDSPASASSVGVATNAAVTSLLLGDESKIFGGTSDRTDSIFSFAAAGKTEDAHYLIEEPTAAWSALSSSFGRK